MHFQTSKPEEINIKRMKKTFEVNIFSMFYFVKYALPHIKKGASITNTSSVTAYRGSAKLIDYAATKGAICIFYKKSCNQPYKKGYPCK